MGGLQERGSGMPARVRPAIRGRSFVGGALPPDPGETICSDVQTRYEIASSSRERKARKLGISIRSTSILSSSIN